MRRTAAPPFRREKNKTAPKEPETKNNKPETLSILSSLQ